MADLTWAAQGVLNEVDPQATLTTASSTVIQTKNYVNRSWFAGYMAALRARAVRPDSIAVHLYPGSSRVLATARSSSVSGDWVWPKQVIANNGFAKLPIWDTEMNYGNQRPSNPWPKVKYSQNKGSAYLAQTYLYSLSNGVTQVYWYGWDDYGLGIWPTSKSGRVLKPG